MPRKAMETLTESMFYVLMALLREEKCGIEIACWVERRTKGRLKLGPATLYTVLAKFEQEKWIKETSVVGRKRTYRITEKGRTAYQAEYLRLKQCIADADKEEENE